MEFKGKFSELEEKFLQYYKEHTGYLCNLDRYNIVYIDGKYLNNCRKIYMDLYSDVIFDDDVMYKTWWDTHPSSWYLEHDSLTFVEVDDSNEGKEFRYRRREIEEIVKRLTAEQEELEKKEKMPKYMLTDNTK